MKTSIIEDLLREVIKELQKQNRPEPITRPPRRDAELARDAEIKIPEAEINPEATEPRPKLTWQGPEPNHPTIKIYNRTTSKYESAVFDWANRCYRLPTYSELHSGTIRQIFTW